ncbi:acetyl-CoA C-acyltransferase [Acidipropionibacterium timonense]|uniref:acetyl-CoA C-acyltransferase n=1 Tax=Acidipropionibacterium timonense TaxID=2161818 RepID=UPI00102FD427|nr:acetyl-CoA C-acyltransferase [Acidipropionibacterium timonense]
MPRSLDRADDVVIVGARRTPFGRLNGSLGSVPATELGAIAIRAALADAGAAPEAVDMVVMGQVLQAGVGQNPAKQASRGAGIPGEAHTETVNKVCLSGLTSVIDIARAIRLGDAEVGVAGGMESMSQAPFLLPGPAVRGGTKVGGFRTGDHLQDDGLTSAALGISMGLLTEQFAERYPVSRRDQDELAARSHERAAAFLDAGGTARQIAPVPVRTRRGEELVREDEGVRRDCTVETLSRLRPVFDPAGTVTAGNASPISDGAGAVVLTTRRRADREGWPVLATVEASGQVAGADESLQAIPAKAISRALGKQGWHVADLDLVEINEAFAAVVIHSARVLGLPIDLLNEAGGAIALGHPIGASGSRVAVHVAHQLHDGVGEHAAVALCGGGGQGEALLLRA